VAYFLSFGITVPIAFYMIVYGLYLLRTYLVEHVAYEVTAKEKISETLIDKLPLRVKSMISLTGKPSAYVDLLKQPTSEKDERAISAVKRSPSPAVSGQTNVLKFESDGDGVGKKVRLKSVFVRPNEIRRRSRLASTQLPAVMSAEVSATVEEHNERAIRSAAASPASSNGNKREEVLNVLYF